MGRELKVLGLEPIEQIYKKNQSVNSIFLRSNDVNSLICQIEIGPVITLFGRVVDDHERWQPEMQKLIAAIDPPTTAHMSDSERSKYHPQGSPKKVGYKYIHHVHSPHNLSETLKRASPWIDDNLYDLASGFVDASI